MFKRIFINIYAGMSSDGPKEGDTVVMTRRQRNVANDLENSFDLPLFWGAYIAVLTGSAGGACSNEALALCVLFPVYVAARLCHAFFHLTDARPAPAPRTAFFFVGVLSATATCGVLLSAASRTFAL